MTASDVRSMDHPLSISSLLVSPLIATPDPVLILFAFPASPSLAERIVFFEAVFTVVLLSVPMPISDTSFAWSGMFVTLWLSAFEVLMVVTRVLETSRESLEPGLDGSGIGSGRTGLLAVLDEAMGMEDAIWDEVVWEELAGLGGLNRWSRANLSDRAPVMTFPSPEKC